MRHVRLSLMALPIAVLAATASGQVRNKSVDCDTPPGINVPATRAELNPLCYPGSDLGEQIANAT